MMEKTALGSQIQVCRTSFAKPSDGSDVAKRLIPKKIWKDRSHSPDTFIGHYSYRGPTKHRARSSLPATSDPRPRSSRQSIPIGHALGNGLVQPIFRPPSRRSPFGMAFRASPAATLV